jgi:hypothetical protein
MLGMATHADAVTRYAEVGGDGPPSGAEPCPLANPCDLQASVEDASVANGDEVIVLPGSYDLGTSTLTIGDSITVRGQGPGQRPLISGTATGFPALVEVASPSGPPPAQLLDLDISSGGTNSLLITRGEANRVNVVHNGGFLSVACQLSVEATVNDSICSASNAGGIGLVFALSGGTLSNAIRNVTAYSAQAEAIAVSSSNGSHTLNIKNTIASGVTDVSATASATGTATLNAVGSNYSTTAVAGDGTKTITPPGTAGNQTAEPALASPVVGDFHQLPGSLTINGGADGVSALDLDGMPRLQGAAPDIGAHEYDLIAPDTTILKQPRKRTRSTRARLTFSSTESGSGFRCKVDRKQYRDCSSPLRLKRLKEGRHKVLVAAVDAAENQDQTASVARWRVLRG